MDPIAPLVISLVIRDARGDLLSVMDVAALSVDALATVIDGIPLNHAIEFVTR